jgi:type I restriction enzyme M protein
LAKENKKSTIEKQLDISALETWLWEAACKIRGPVNVASTKNWILPLIILKRLSGVFDD